MEQMHYRVRVTIFNDYAPDSLGFGKGICQLLSEIERTGSIRQAGLQMGMAYSKAWKIILKTEKEFGVPLLDRGRRSGSTLTAEAQALLLRYRTAQNAAQKAVEEQMAAFSEPLA